jgi:hypothetical protein
MIQYWIRVMVCACEFIYLNLLFLASFARPWGGAGQQQQQDGGGQQNRQDQQGDGMRREFV